MIPKRKLIRKQFVAPETTHHEQTNLCEGDLIQQLKSTDQRAKTDAIAAIANLQLISDQLQEELYSTTTLAELMKILITTSNYSLTQTTLFALNNLCLRETENNPIDKTVNTLFNIGLDKALLQLDSSNANLIKPILVFMANIAEFVPSQYQYLLLGIQSTLINGCQKYLKQSPYYDLVLEFLMKSNAQIAIEQKEDQTYNIEKITPEQLHCIKLLQQIAQINKMYKNRAMATKILLVMTKGKAKQCVQLFCTNFEQLITDIDLEREYLANFHNKQVEQQLQDDEEIEQIQKEQNIMQQQKKQKNKGKNKEIIPKQQEQTSHSMFIDGVQAIQILLQFIVQQFEDEDNFDEEEVDEQQMEEKGQIQQELDVGFSNAIFLPYIKGCLVKSICQFQKYAKLSFIEGQNIIELILRTILSLPSDIITNTKQENKINVLGLAQLTESIIVNQFKYEMSNPNQIPKQNFIFNFKTCLQIILKLKTISNRSLYIELPFLKYEVENNKSHDGKVIAINNQWKQCWIALLEIFSMFYNPEKTQNVTQNQNRSIGAILRQLIIQIPQIQLEQWRAQAIDTLFDVYSNENFDKIFMDNGFVDILNQVLKVAGSSNKMGQKKSKKSNNFISAVVTDIQRFISYKKKMIGF